MQEPAPDHYSPARESAYICEYDGEAADISVTRLLALFGA